MRKFAFSIMASMTASGILALFGFIYMMMGDKAFMAVCAYLALMFLIQAMILAQTVEFDTMGSTPSTTRLLPHILNKAWCVWAVAVSAPFDRGPWVSLIWVAVLAIICRSMCRNIGDMIFILTKKFREEKLSQLEEQERAGLAQEVENTLRAEVVKSKRQQKMEDDLMADLGSFLSDVELPEDKK